MPKAPQFIGPGAVDVAFTVNGDAVTVHVPPHRTLLDTLRGTLGLTGAKRVCDEGTCGACTVLLDGEPVYSCMTLAVACAGGSVRTVEGLSRDAGVGAPESEARLHPLQEAFIAHDAFQCGFCTPGQLMSAVALLERNARPSSEDVLRAVSGNLCRCGAYPSIVAATLAAAKAQAKR